MIERKYTQIAFSDGSSVRMSFLDNMRPGVPVLFFIHGLGTFAETWEPLTAYLESSFRCILPELPGFGFSCIPENGRPQANLDQAAVLRKLIEQLDLHRITLVTHSMGISYILPQLIESQRLRKRISRMVLISPCGVFRELPRFVRELSYFSEKGRILRFANDEAMARLILRWASCRKDAIRPEVILSYAECLGQPNAKESLIANAKQVRLPRITKYRMQLASLNLPCLILTGNRDTLTDPDDAKDFQIFLNADFHPLENCGHIPFLEVPEKIAEEITLFMHANISLPEEPPPLTGFGSPRVMQAMTQRKQEQGKRPFSIGKTPGKPHFHMASLFDRWTAQTLILLIIIKFLQLLKKMGVRAGENGWRKVTGIFLKDEYSKFTLGVFRLKIPGLNKQKIRSGILTDFSREKWTAEKLRLFLKRRQEIHWSVMPGLFHMKRQINPFTDLLILHFAEDGLLQDMTPLFDQEQELFQGLPPRDAGFIMQEFIRNYNRLRGLPDSIRAKRMVQSMRRSLLKRKILHFSVRSQMKLFVRRLLCANSIRFEMLPDPENAAFLRRRLATPDILTFRHPGTGLLNIICRVTPEWDEADFWFQFHHVPVDGLPMQEMIDALKAQWTQTGPLKFPALSSPDAKPEIVYSGSHLFRARIYLNFDPLMKLRKYLNKNYLHRMGGPATVASLLIWGLGQSTQFHSSKFLFPVDMGCNPQRNNDRELGLVFIRPQRFNIPGNPFQGFLAFQAEFNARLSRTQLRLSESYEILELCAVMHPLLYNLTKFLFPKALHDIVGTSGISVLKNAEMFVTPLTELQPNGFIAAGRLNVPCEDGRTAGAVTICGSRRQVRMYMEALRWISEKPEESLGLNPDYLTEQTELQKNENDKSCSCSQKEKNSL